MCVINGRKYRGAFLYFGADTSGRSPACSVSTVFEVSTNYEAYILVGLSCSWGTTTSCLIGTCVSCEWIKHDVTYVLPNIFCFGFATYIVIVLMHNLLFYLYLSQYERDINLIHLVCNKLR